MPLELGAAFAPRQVEIIDVEEPRQIDIEALRSEQLLVALEALREALTTMPAPVVNVSEPDLTAIVQAVTQLKGPATADEIARAVVNEISPGGEPGMGTVLVKLTDALEKLDFRMQGLAGSTGGGGVGVSDINDRATRVLGKVDVTSTPGLTREQLDAASVTIDGAAQLLGSDGVNKVAVGTAGNIYTSSTGALKASQGRVWLAGSRQTVSLSSTTASIVMWNPAGSGKNIQVFHFNVTGTVAGDVDFFHTHADISTFGAAVTPLNPNHYYDAATAAAMVRAGAGVPAVIDVRSPIRRVNTQSPVEFDGLIILGPGHGFGLRVGGATGDGAFYMNARWIEDPL